MSLKKNKKQDRGRRKPNTPSPAKFAVENLVHVKPGTIAPDFTDIPLGGWAGTISEVNQRPNPPTYLIEWNQNTLDQMHPVYRSRCERDDLSLESMWLCEADLELDSGGQVVIEQPRHIVTRPLSQNDQEDRIRAIFALTSNDPLPLANLENLRRYARYLEAQLSFPFQAKYFVETSPLQQNENIVTVVGLLDADDFDEEDGILCDVKERSEFLELPLADLEVCNYRHYRQLIEDYSYWFGNWSSEDWDSPTPTPHSKWSVVQLILKCGLGAGLCGMVLGSLLAASENAGIGAIAGALILGIIGWLMGKPNATVLDEETQIKHGSIFAGILGVMGGWLFGSLLGVMLVAFVGTISGSIVGWLVWRLAASVTRKSVDPLPGIILGALVGAVLFAWYLDAEKAVTGALMGAGIGVIAGPMLFLATSGIFWWLAQPRRHLREP